MWLFFRCDDLGWNPKEFARLVTLFARHDQKLNAAAIPAELNDASIQASIPYSYQAAPYLQVVTHGYRHQNYELEDKKSEFGSARSLDEVRAELTKGRAQLAERFENYYPCFVPPWNRFEDRFLDLLPEAGFQMLSRDERTRKLKAPLPEFDVGIDLHTSKSPVRLSAKEIFRELARRNEAGIDCTGVMLHHCKMTEEDFSILDDLLKEISKRGIASLFFSDLVPGNERRREIEMSHV